MIENIILYRTEIVCSLLMTTLTSCVSYGVWRGVGGQLEKNGCSRMRYAALLGLIPCFLVPALHHVMFSIDQKVYPFFSGYYMSPNGSIASIAGVLLFIWAAGVLFMTIHYLKMTIRFYKTFHNAEECSDEWNGVFRECCRKLGVSDRRVSFIQSYAAVVPFQSGLIRPRIILPEKEYQKDELEVILLHELAHYRHRDMWLRKIGMLIKIIQWYNPCAWAFLRSLVEYSEYSCDRAAVSVYGNRRQYFDTMISLAEKGPAVDNCLAASLTGECEMTKRIRKGMTEYKTKKRIGRGLLNLAVMAMLALCLILAGSRAYAYGYAQIVKTTEVRLPVQMMEMPEYAILNNDHLDEGFVEEFGELIALRNMTSRYSFDWTIHTGVRRISSYLALNAGDTLVISGLIEPSDKTVTVGIIEPGNQTQFVNATDVILASFNISSSGSYKVFIQNNSGVTIQAAGCVRVQ